MSDVVTFAWAICAGTALGAFFFGGLWWTVARGLSSQRVALWFLASSLLRTSLSLAGFFLVSGGQWDRLLACLLGFVGARFIVMRLSRSVETRNSSVSRAGHAP